MQRYWTGIILILIGGVFLLDSMGVLEFHRVLHRFWPVILIIVGIGILLKGGRR